MRSFTIPAAAALALSTTACNADDPILGDWDLVEFDGETGSDAPPGGAEFEDDEGEIVGEFNVYSYGAELEVEKTGDGEYDIDVKFEFDGDDSYEWSWECELDEDDLDCKDHYDEDLRFERD